uniref:Uncharacterized protein n=1 Tax=Arundo donax TaxID=35708 RepID=A0A0A9GIJ4_ARUDO
MILPALLLQELFYLFWQVMSKTIICWIQKLVSISFLNY